MTPELERCDFTFAHYRFHLTPREPLEMPAMGKGTTIRGGFGTAFRRLVCIDLRLDCAACDLRYTCPYTQVFNPFVPPDAERLSKNQNIPRPFVIKPPLETTTRYLPGEPLVFDFVVMGEAINYLPYFIVAWRELTAGGFGLNRARCVLSTIEALSLGGSVSAVYDGKEGVVRPPQENLRWEEITARVAAFCDLQEITVHFLTPTTVKAEGEMVTVPQFHHLIKRLRDRVNALSYFYCGGALDLDFRKLGEQAEQIKTVSVHSRWVDRNRRTRRGETQDLSGFVGAITYRGELAPFLPLLLLGEYIHVGKNAAFGNGWYQMEQADHSR
ncbi:MAG: CRISPR system precrRNA processing endoribonuclease RAMP protein Cas6 [Candidatus Binatia bacterium]